MSLCAGKVGEVYEDQNVITAPVVATVDLAFGIVMCPLMAVTGNLGSARDSTGTSQHVSNQDAGTAGGGTASSARSVKCGKESLWIDDPPPIEKTRYFPYPYAEVWQAAVGLIAEEGLLVTSADRDSGVLSTDDKALGSSVNSWVQCKGRFNEFTGTATGENYERTFYRLSITVRGTSDSQTAVTVNSYLRGEREEAHGTGMFIPHGNERIVQKPSNGALEREFFDRLGAALAEGQ